MGEVEQHLAFLQDWIPRCENRLSHLGRGGAHTHAMRIAREAWRRYTELLARRPLVAQAMQSATLWSVGDTAAQQLSRWQHRTDVATSVEGGDDVPLHEDSVVLAKEARTETHARASPSSEAWDNTAKARDLVAKPNLQESKQETNAGSDSGQAITTLGPTGCVSQTKACLHQHDFKRTALTALYAAGIAAPLGHLWYKWLHAVASKRFVKGSMRFIGAKVFVDTVVFGPLHILEYFTCMHILEGGSFDTLKKKIKTDLLPTFAAECMYWPPVQWFNFKLIPVQHQLLAVNIASLVDTTFLSWVKHLAGEGSWLEILGITRQRVSQEKETESSR